MQMPLGYDPAKVMKLGIGLHIHDSGEWLLSWKGASRSTRRSTYRR